MTAKSTKTIDNLGFQVYLQYEEEKKGYEESYISDSKSVASQLETDIFEPILITDYQILFDLVPKPTSWSFLFTPEEFNDQKKRLFTHQLAPKLGPEEYLEMQIERIEDHLEDQEKEEKEQKQKKERLFAWQDEGDVKIMAKEAETLIELLKSINILNKIMIDVNAERYRYAKG